MSTDTHGLAQLILTIFSLLWVVLLPLLLKTLLFPIGEILY